VKLVNLRSIFEGMRRVVILARKPEPEDYKLLLKITWVGFLLVGVIAFVIQLVMYLVYGGV